MSSTEFGVTVSPVNPKRVEVGGWVFVEDSSLLKAAVIANDFFEKRAKQKEDRVEQAAKIFAEGYPGLIGSGQSWPELRVAMRHLLKAMDDGLVG